MFFVPSQVCILCGALDVLRADARTFLGPNTFSPWHPKRSYRRRSLSACLKACRASPSCWWQPQSAFWWIESQRAVLNARCKRAPLGLATVAFGMAALITDRLVYVGAMLIVFTCFSELASCVAQSIFSDSLMPRSLSERSSAYTKSQAFQVLGRGVSEGLTRRLRMSHVAAGLNGVALLASKASKGSEEWGATRLKATLSGGFLLLFPTICVLMAFRDPPERKCAEEERLEMSAKHRLVPFFLVISLFCAWMGAGLIIKFLPLFFIHIHGLSPEGLSLLQCVSAFAVALFTKILGDCAHWCGRAPMSALCLGGVALCLVLMSKVHNIWCLAGLFICRGSFAAANFALTWSYLMDCTPPAHRGKWNSLLSVLSMSWSATAVVGGAIDRVSYEASFETSAGVFGVSLVFLVAAMALSTKPCVVVVDPFSTGAG